jgi:hypothetical protein
MGTGLCASKGSATVSTVLAKHTCKLYRLRHSWNAKGGETVGCPVEVVLSTATHKLDASSVTSHNSAVQQQPNDTPCEWVTRQSVTRRVWWLIPWKYSYRIVGVVAGLFRPEQGNVTRGGQQRPMHHTWHLIRVMDTKMCQGNLRVKSTSNKMQAAPFGTQTVARY